MAPMPHGTRVRVAGVGVSPPPVCRARKAPAASRPPRPIAGHGTSRRRAFRHNDGPLEALSAARFMSLASALISLAFPADLTILSPSLSSGFQRAAHEVSGAFFLVPGNLPR